MNNCEIVLKDFQNIAAYREKFPKDNRSAAMELLVSKGISNILNLPFYNSGNDDVTKTNKVLWHGKNEQLPICGSSDNSDTIIYARNYDILLEVTNTTGTKQWKLEFAPALRHYENYLKSSNRPEDEIFLFLIAPKIHEDTYNSIRQKVIEGYKILVFTYDNIKQILEVCNLTIGLRQIDFRILIDTLLVTFEKTSNADKYNEKSNKQLNEWKEEFLIKDRLVFLSVSSYQVIKNHKIMTASDILTEIQTWESFKKYFEIIGNPPKREEITKGMLTFGFAYLNGSVHLDPILSPAKKEDIDQRMTEILENLQRP